jgi:myo-inositol 2-dehydrogenase / D-chiro-inositol 1-dehydrogenase
VASASIGLAVFGAGRIGAVHARNAARNIPGAHLVGIADLDRMAARHVADAEGIDRIDDARAFLGDPEVKGIIIATPTATHADLIEQAAKAGKHILCEKPIALDLAATKLAALRAEQAGVILQVGFQRRFDAEFARARRSVEDGALGAMRFVRLVGRDHRMPPVAYLRTSGGQFKDQMVHEFDLARWIMSPLVVEEVFATGSALIDPSIAGFGDVDTSLVVLRFSGGAIGVIDDSREAIYGYDVRGEIHGSKGMMLIGAGRLRNGELLGAEHATADVESFIERFADAYRDEVIDFVAAIRERRAPRVGATDALEALRIAIAADRSLRSQRPVSLAGVIDD